jgi:hypothetical protein
MFPKRVLARTRETYFIIKKISLHELLDTYYYYNISWIYYVLSHVLGRVKCTED